MRERPTAEQARQYRETHECGLEIARLALHAEWRRSCIQDIRVKSGELYTIDQCRDVICELLELLMQD